MTIRQLPRWAGRPPEVANLLNPAFASLVLRAAARGYEREERLGLPLPLTYLILPIVLHAPTRNALPKTARTRLHAWLQEHQSLTPGFAARVARVAPYSREALVFGIRFGIMSLSEGARVLTTKVRLKRFDVSKGSEPVACIEKAETLGRLLARGGDSQTIMSMWGVCL